MSTILEDKKLQETIDKNSFFIKDTEIILENKGLNQGEITIIDKTYGRYNMYWGAMGGTIQEFILHINSDYFSDKLLGTKSTQVFDVKKTFSKLRKYIREDMCLPWYKHKEFQANLRENMNLFQERCGSYNSENYFVDHFKDYLFNYLSFYLIEDKYERQIIEKEFKEISEVWNFIQTKESEVTVWLKAIHTKIKKKLIRNSTDKSKTREHRIEIVNEIIHEIAKRGRNFFSGKFGIAEIFQKNGRLYMKNEYNGTEMYLNTKFGYPPKGWHHGGTLWGLTKDFKDFINTGQKSNHNNGYGGLYSTHWGYSESDMVAIQDKAKELGYL